MHASEFANFETVVRRLEKVFSKKIDDDTMQAYWGALKDLQFAVFRRFAERHERYGKFFPKPSELRAKEDKLPEVQGGKNDADFKEAEARCIRNLEELRARDPDQWRKEVGIRKLDRLVAITHESHPAYQGILNEWRQARGIHVGEKELQAARINDQHAR